MHWLESSCSYLFCKASKSLGAEFLVFMPLIELTPMQRQPLAQTITSSASFNSSKLKGFSKTGIYNSLQNSIRSAPVTPGKIKLSSGAVLKTPSFKIATLE